MRLSDFRIGARLGMAFGVCVLITAALGGTALVLLGRINANTDDLATNWLPSTAQLAEMEATLNEFRRAQSDQVMSEGDDLAVAGDARLKKLLLKFQDQQAQYERMIRSDEERTRYSKFTTDLAAFLVTSRGLTELTLGGANKHLEARAYYRDVSRPAFFAIVADFKSLIELNHQGGILAYQHSQASYAEARSSVLLALVLAMVVAAALAVSITRRITVPIGGAVASVRQVAGGDLTRALRADGRDEVADLTRGLEQMRSSLAQLVVTVRDKARTVASASEQISRGNQNLSERTESQASALEQTAASMEELSATVRNNADSAREADAQATGAAEVATRGGRVVAEVVATMQGIRASARRIAEIIAVIDGIAFQTNLLALNAAVEAARAGEQGRGFAVVASEVRGLAQRTAAAARDIKDLITESVDEVGRGASLVEQAGATIQEVVEAVKRVQGNVAAISASSAEQSKGVAEVGEAVSQLDEATQRNAALVEESASAAAMLQLQARELVAEVEVFRVSATELAVGAPGVSPSSSFEAPPVARRPRQVAA